MTRNDIQLTLWNQLDDLDFADDLDLFAHSQQEIQDKTTGLTTTSVQIDLDIHPQKTQVLKITTSNSDPVTLKGNKFEEVKTFTYLGSIVSHKEAQMKMSNLGSERQEQHSSTLEISGRPSKYAPEPLFNSNVKFILLYRSETWITTKTTVKKIQSFINLCPQKILKVHWSDTINNTNYGREHTSCQQNRQSREEGGNGLDTG